MCGTAVSAVHGRNHHLAKALPPGQWNVAHAPGSGAYGFGHPLLPLNLHHHIGTLVAAIIGQIPANAPELV